MARRAVTRNERAKYRETSHQKPRDNSPSVTRFFKVMFGNDHWNVLYLPPKFAREVQHLVGQKTEIEDSDGTRWPVTYSHVNGSLAFQKGWSEFFVNHGLKAGHFVLFNYVNETHFVVQIFDESAMEITDFNYMGPRNNKRPRPNPEIISVDDPSQPADENLKEKPSSANSVGSQSESRDFRAQPNVTVGPIAMTMDGPSQNVKAEPMCTRMDDPSLMIDRRGYGCYSQEGINILYDLSCFEMEKKTVDLNVFEKSLFATEQVNKKADDTVMAESYRQINDVNMFEEAFGKKTESCHTDNTKTNAQICVENLDKASENKVAAPRSVKMEHVKMAVIHENHESNRWSKKMEQIMLKEGDAQTDVNRSKKINCHSGNILADKLRVKPSNNINLRKSGRLDVVSGFSNGDNKLWASGIESLSVNRIKSTERRDYAAKPQCPKFSVSSGVPKSPLVQRVVKKEKVELRVEGKGSPEVPYGKSQINAMQDGKMFLAPVKVEPDLPYDAVSSGAPSPFSAEVKSQLYLELPVDIPSAPGRRVRGNGKVIYLRDLNGRLFPVLYPALFNVKALTSNWNRFCEKNGLKPGDECRLEVEDLNKSYYRVGITRSQALTSNWNRFCKKKGFKAKR